MHTDRTQAPKKNSIERTLHLRVRDKHAGFLLEQSRWVNFVWNYDNELSWQVLDREGRFLSGYDLHEFTRGATKEGLPLHSQTVQAVNEEYARSLAGVPIGLWDSYGLSEYELGPGCFSEDARGRWYLNITVKKERPAKADSIGTRDVGIDRGLRDLIATSDSTKVEAARFHRDLEPALAIVQRAGKNDRVRSLHAKIKNRRKDFLHKPRCGPKGIAGLGIREWLCAECATAHDRDVNSARNHLAAGRRRLAEGILVP